MAKLVPVNLKTGTVSGFLVFLALVAALFAVVYPLMGACLAVLTLLLALIGSYVTGRGSREWRVGIWMSLFAVVLNLAAMILAMVAGVEINLESPVVVPIESK